jgi:DNA topoisomerase IB
MSETKDPSTGKITRKAAVDADGKAKMEPNIHHVDEVPERVSGLKAVAWVHPTDGTGKLKRVDIYATDHWQRAADAKFGKADRFASNVDSFRAKVDADMKSADPKVRTRATIAKLIDTHYIRVGGSEEEERTGSAGASTLKAEHVKDLGKDGLRLQFQGKSHHMWDVHVTDPALVGSIRAHADGKSGAQPLFGVPASAVNEYIESASPQKVTAKDFRTFHAGVLLTHRLSTLPEPKSKAEAESNVNAAVEYSAALLGHTAAVDRSDYQDPRKIGDYMQRWAHLPEGSKPGKKATKVV